MNVLNMSFLLVYGTVKMIYLSFGIRHLKKQGVLPSNYASFFGTDDELFFKLTPPISTVSCTGEHILVFNYGSWMGEPQL